MAVKVNDLDVCTEEVKEAGCSKSVSNLSEMAETVVMGLIELSHEEGNLTTADGQPRSPEKPVEAGHCTNKAHGMNICARPVYKGNRRTK